MFNTLYKTVRVNRKKQTVNFCPKLETRRSWIACFLTEMLIWIFAALEKALRIEPWEGPEKGERNASLLMAAPGSVEGRDTGRVGFNGGSKGRRGWGDRQLGPSALWKTHRALETQDVGMQAGRTGLDTPSPPAPLQHTHKDTHTIAFSPFLS